MVFHLKQLQDILIQDILKIIKPPSFPFLFKEGVAVGLAADVVGRSSSWRRLSLPASTLFSLSAMIIDSLTGKALTAVQRKSKSKNRVTYIAWYFICSEDYENLNFMNPRQAETRNY